MSYSTNYFEHLAKASLALLNQLPIELTPQPLDYSLTRLKPILDKLKEKEVNILVNIPKELSYNEPHKLASGLNTVGMLADRFTILLIREWCIRNKGIPDNEKADQLFKTQTMEIIQALSEAHPGFSSLNSKITFIKAGAQAISWEDAYYGLFTTNILLWESQEVLYIKDIKSLPSEEIRNYIKWFSYGNILRNEYIQLCESLYWAQFKVLS